MSPRSIQKTPPLPAFQQEDNDSSLSSLKALQKRNGNIVLLGTCRAENLAWVRKTGFYNLPLAVGQDPLDFSVFSRIVVYCGDLSPVAFSAEFCGVIEKDWLKHHGYKLAENPHGDRYALFQREKAMSPDKVLRDSQATFCVCSTRLTRIVSPADWESGKAFCEGESIPNLYAKIKPYFVREKRQQLCGVPPQQMDLFAQLFAERKQTLASPIRYTNGVGQADLTVVPGTAGAKPYRLGEFFCGPGGLACGAISARVENPLFRIEHAWANDYDQDTCDTYAENICRGDSASVICHDVRTLDIGDSRMRAIDGFAFGFPCNDFSVVGEQKGFNGKFGPLFQYGVNVLEKFRPMWFLAENVGGLATANEGSAFKVILGKLQAAGYRIYPHLYKFEDYGVPQARHRIIIVGLRNDLPGEFRPPNPDILETRHKTCRQAMEEPPIPEWVGNNDRTAQHPRVVERLSYIKPGENAFTANLPAHLQLHVRGAKISQIYKRLDPDKPAYTVTGSGGGGTHIYHYAELRALTNRERARLQTFPDRFVFKGSKESVRKQIGMAVPPRGAQIIFEALLRTLAGIPYRSVPCNISASGDFLSKEAVKEACG